MVDRSTLLQRLMLVVDTAVEGRAVGCCTVRNVQFCSQNDTKRGRDDAMAYQPTFEALFGTRGTRSLISLALLTRGGASYRMGGFSMLIKIKVSSLVMLL